jgi:hypothetical protein
MPMHKLKDSPITLTVADIAQVEGNFGVQYKITSDDGTDVYVNVAPFDRQLGRLSLDVETLIGKTIRMEQVQKNGTTFTNVSLARAGGTASAPAAASSAPRAAAAPAAPKLTVSEASALYREALMGVYQTLGDACAELGVPVTADALQAAAATVFIAANRR